MQESGLPLLTRSERAVDSLIDLLKDDSFAVRFLAAEALGIIKDEKAIQPLANAWSTEEDYADQKEAMKLIYNHISK
jgi:HEAT repeat protein